MRLSGIHCNEVILLSAMMVFRWKAQKSPNIKEGTTLLCHITKMMCHLGLWASSPTKQLNVSHLFIESYSIDLFVNWLSALFRILYNIQILASISFRYTVTIFISATILFLWKWLFLLTTASYVSLTCKKELKFCIYVSNKNLMRQSNFAQETKYGPTWTKLKEYSVGHWIFDL